MNIVVVKYAQYLSHDGNQYREKWRKKINLQNLVSLPLTFLDRCQLLHLLAIDTRVLLRIATPGILPQIEGGVPRQIQRFLCASGNAQSNPF